MAASPGRLESLVAMLNLDVIGCCGDTLEASSESSVMVDRLRAAAQRDGVTVDSDHAITPGHHLAFRHKIELTLARNDCGAFGALRRLTLGDARQVE